jgi:hypothetical protein
MQIVDTTAVSFTSTDRTNLGTILSRTDVATSTRLATSGYTTPPTTGAIATAVGAQITSDHGAGIYVSVSNSGAFNITCTCQRSDNSVLLEGVLVRLSQAGVTKWQGFSNASGVVTPSVNAGTYVFSATAASYQLNSPTSLVVTADATQTVLMDPLVVSTPTAPGTLTLNGYTRDMSMVIVPNAVLEFEMVRSGATTGTAVVESTRQVTSDGTGYFEFQAQLSSKYRYRPVGASEWETVVVNDSGTQQAINVVVS